MGNQNIKITIGEKIYPLSINAEREEEVVRYAAKRVNERINYYKSKYPKQNLEEVLSIAFLENMIKVVNLEQDNELNDLLEETKLLDNKLSDYIVNL